jgi:Nitrile hydratase, alpha chain
MGNFMLNNQTNRDNWVRVIAKAWSDPTFEKKLMANPGQVLREENIEVPPNATIHVLKNTEKDLNLVIPSKPKGELSEDELKKKAAGVAATLVAY